MERRIKGNYSGHATRHVSNRWAQVCADHEEEFPEIHQCCPGTFNIKLSEKYVPPNENTLRERAKVRGKSVNRYEDGNHLSPYAKVVKINEIPVEAWIYRGGHPTTVLELLSRQCLAEVLKLDNRDAVIVTIHECPEGMAGMPGVPSDTPGATIG